jgi:hypothetical protein
MEDAIRFLTHYLILIYCSGFSLLVPQCFVWGGNSESLCSLGEELKLFEQFLVASSRLWLWLKMFTHM